MARSFEINPSKNQKLTIGYQGENLASEITFDFSGWFEEYGDGQINMLHQRNGDTAPYPVALTVDGSIARWLITEVDTAIPGKGRCEYIYTVGGVVVKSAVYETKVLSAISGYTDAPPPASDWVNDVLNAAAKVIDAQSKPPRIGDNGNWFVFDPATGLYKDTGYPASGGGGSYCHVKYLESPDADGNYINLRDIESGTYILHGRFIGFQKDSSTKMVSFSYGFPSVIGRTEERTYLSCIYPPDNTIQYLLIDSDGMTRKDAKLVNMESKANLVTEIYDNADDAHYPSAKAVRDGLAKKADVTDGTVISGNADFAEVGEWADGNADGENRIGYFVAVDTSSAGTTMVKATSTADVRGVTVANPAFSGNCPTYKFDDETGYLLKKYDFVAVMGLVSIIDNGTCTINGRCMPGDDGTAVPSSNSIGYQVIDRIDNTHVLIALEPGADMIHRIKTDVTKLKSDISTLYEEIANKAANVYIGPVQPTDGTVYWLDTSESGSSGGGTEETVTYAVTADLTNVTIDNTDESVTEGVSFAATLTAVDGYSISSVIVTMGGVNITSTAYANGNIYIASVTGNIVITATAVEVAEEVTIYTITNNLVNVTSDNSAVSVEENSAYTATLTASTDYKIDTVTVTMGGVDVTADVYTDGVIAIPAVTGDVVITATTISAPVSAVFELETPMTFDGSEEYQIDYCLTDKDKDWSAVIDFTATASGASYVFRSGNTGINSLGIRAQAGYFWFAQIQYYDNKEIGYGAFTNKKVVFTHINGSNELNVYYVDTSGSKQAYTFTRENYVSDLCGTSSVTAIGKHPCTIDDFKCYARVISESEINTFLGVE